MPNAIISPWFGQYTFELNQTFYLNFGTLEVWITRKTKEWLIHYTHHHTLLDEPEQVQIHPTAEIPKQSDGIKRIVTTQTHSSLDIMPLLADRALVSRPTIPTIIAQGEVITLFVTCSCWCHIKIHGTDITLLDIPIKRYSDTWFGPNPREGELCYASKTSASLDAEGYITKPYRAKIPIKIINRLGESFCLERLNIPVPYLDVFIDEQYQLWGQGLSFLRELPHKNIKIRANKTEALEKLGLKRIVSARQTSDENIMMKAFDMLFA